jgi:hypothetical protein
VLGWLLAVFALGEICAATSWAPNPCGSTRPSAGEGAGDGRERAKGASLLPILRDDEVIAAADRAGAAMVLTGIRHFRH